MVEKIENLDNYWVTITKISSGINTAGKRGLIEKYDTGPKKYLITFEAGWQGWYTRDEFILGAEEEESPPDEIHKMILEAATGLVGAFLYYDRKDDEELSLYMVEQAVKDGVITVEEITEAFTIEFKEQCQHAIEELL